MNVAAFHLLLIKKEKRRVLEGMCSWAGGRKDGLMDEQSVLNDKLPH